MSRLPHKNSTAIFIEKRREKKEKKNKEKARLLANYKLTCKLGTPERVKTSFFKEEEYYDINDDVIGSEALKACYLCHHRFSLFSVKKREQCRVCMNIVCNECKKYKLPVSNSKETMNVCTRCFKYLAHKKMLKQFKKKKNGSKDRIHIFYNTAMSSIEHVKGHLPQFLGIAELLEKMYYDDEMHIDLDNFDEIVSSVQSLMESLANGFQIISERLKRIKNINFTLEREIQIQKYIKISLAIFLQDELPTFTVKQRQLEKILSDPSFRTRIEESEKKRKIKEEQRKKRREKKKQNTPEPTILDKIFSNSPKIEHYQPEIRNDLSPSINLVMPALVYTIGGVPITVEGNNFSRDIAVQIGDVKVKSHSIMINEQDGRIALTVITPPASEGPKSIKLTNPNKKYAIVEDALMYVDPSLLMDYDENERRKNEIKVALTDEEVSDEYEQDMGINQETNPFDSSEEVNNANGFLSKKISNPFDSDSDDKPVYENKVKNPFDDDSDEILTMVPKSRPSSRKSLKDKLSTSQSPTKNAFGVEMIQKEQISKYQRIPESPKISKAKPFGNEESPSTIMRSRSKNPFDDSPTPPVAKKSKRNESETKSTEKKSFGNERVSAKRFSHSKNPFDDEPTPLSSKKRISLSKNEKPLRKAQSERPTQTAPLNPQGSIALNPFDDSDEEIKPTRNTSNPFDDSDEDLSKPSRISKPAQNTLLPTSNPFDDSDEEPYSLNPRHTQQSDIAKNPFDESSSEDSQPVPKSNPFGIVSKSPPKSSNPFDDDSW